MFTLQTQNLGTALEKLCSGIRCRSFLLLWLLSQRSISATSPQQAAATFYHSTCLHSQAALTFAVSRWQLHAQHQARQETVVFFDLFEAVEIGLYVCKEKREILS